MHTSAWIARVAVLFEDMKIEVEGLDCDDFSKRFGVRAPARRVYFIRRFTSTFVEFAEALRLLDEEPGFQNIKTKFSRHKKLTWSRAVRYFRHAEPFFKKVRHDVGGHFGGQAAIFAVQHLRPNGVVGSIEVFHDDLGRASVRLHFTSEIEALAILRHLPDSTAEERVERLMRKISAAVKHASAAALILTHDHLWRRFRG